MCSEQTIIKLTVLITNVQNYSFILSNSQAMQMSSLGNLRDFVYALGKAHLVLGGDAGILKYVLVKKQDE